MADSEEPVAPSPVEQLLSDVAESEHRIRRPAAFGEIAQALGYVVYFDDVRNCWSVRKRDA